MRRKQHGFIDRQKYGMEVFREHSPDAPLIVAEAVWQYSHHLLHGSIRIKGPILTVANWSGKWPGLVGMLNLNGSLTKAGVQYDTLWSDDFTDEFFHERPAPVARDGDRSSTTLACHARFEDAEDARRRGEGRELAAGSCSREQGHHGRVRRRLHGHVQRHHPR